MDRTDRPFKLPTPHAAAGLAESMLADAVAALELSSMPSTGEPDEHYATARLIAEALGMLSSLYPYSTNWERSGLTWGQMVAREEAGRKPHLSRLDATKKRIHDAYFSAVFALSRSVISAHEEDLKKLRAGYNHHDPAIQMVWRKYIGEQTPAESWSLIRLLKYPPRPKGRPKGSGGFAAADREVLPEIERRIRNGEPKGKVTAEVAATLPPSGTLQSVVRRLSRRMQKKSD